MGILFILQLHYVINRVPMRSYAVINFAVLRSYGLCSLGRWAEAIPGGYCALGGVSSNLAVSGGSVLPGGSAGRVLIMCVMSVVAHGLVVPNEASSLTGTVLFLYGTSEAGIFIGDCRVLAVSCVPLGIAVGVSTSVCLAATDVIHSLALPSAGMKVDAVPGRLSRFGLTLLSIGSLCASCAEVCGAFHAFMPASLLVMLAWALHTPA